ncbi:MAG TPA: hypothetical protein VN517_08725 [Terriglobales bacterium]|nr:hypothetical protein [Terriglobales bacterium]
MQSGDSATYTVTATPVNGFNQPITLSVETINSGGGDATGVSGTLSPTVIPGGSGTSTLTATTPSSIAASTWSFIVTGTSASGTRTANTAQLSVTGPAQPPPPPPPTLTTSVSPQNTSGSSQVFTFQFSDSKGYQDLLSGKYHILINTTPNGTSSCWMLLQSTGLSLAPDDPGQAWLFVPYGASTTAQNSQCGVSGVGTSISGSGNDLSLSLSLSFTPAYAGARNVYTDVNSSNPGYAAGTTYTVQ